MSSPSVIFLMLNPHDHERRFCMSSTGTSWFSQSVHQSALFQNPDETLTKLKVTLVLDMCQKEFHLKEAWAMLLLLLWQLSSLRLLISHDRPCKLPPPKPPVMAQSVTPPPKPPVMTQRVTPPPKPPVMTQSMTQSVAEHRTHSQAGCSGMAVRPGCWEAAVGEPRADGGATAGGWALGAGLGTAAILWCLLARGAMLKVQLLEEQESSTFNVSEFSHTEISYRKDDCVL